jgi:3-oxoacyl-[acyl-carrier protein] reductase
MDEHLKLSRSVEGLTVLVTGAASGMGRATARVFADEGAKIAVTDYSEDGAQAVAEAIAAAGGTAQAWRLDVTDPAQIEAVVAAAAARFGGLDVLGLQSHRPGRL